MAYSHAEMNFLATLSRLAAAALALTLVTAPANAQQSQLPKPVAQALARAGIPQSSVALFAQGVEATTPLVAFNAAKPMNPASAMKLVTTFAALDLLGPTYTWKTEAYLTGPLKDGVLQGDLLLKGYGDPKLTFERFWLLVQTLRARGVTEIRGDLVLDRTYFELDSHDPAEFDGESLRPYNVGADALLVNFKTVRFLFVPDSELGTVQIIPEPRPAQIDVENHVKLGPGFCGDWRRGLHVALRSIDDRTRVTFSGTMPASCNEHYWNVSLLDHPEFVHGVFRTLWEASGGKLHGRVREGTAALGASPFATIESPTAAEIVRDINKYSNNVMARQVFLTLSAQILDLPGSYERSQRVIRTWLDSRGLALPDLVIENGSGLSRADRISAASLGKLLLTAWASPVMSELMASLPIVAQDGTMKRRLKFQGVAGNAHIKSGSLSDSRTLAGYVLDRNGRRLVVVFLVNDPNARASQPAHDAVLRWAYESALE
ncbi:MAG: D-alanyl-D-alanine carboxypeptidase/D-alanyl-D-alanine-endopeptidase [Betaproteobacteria bacterium]|nr:D-alanyl-D-alanine carboxypeptidase/D-alanyl-D-alanine-endopeptidase [Betaproteobacteria bacterium]